MSKQRSLGDSIGYAVLYLLILSGFLWLVPVIVFLGIEHLFGYPVPRGFLSYLWFWVLYLILFPTKPFPKSPF